MYCNERKKKPIKNNKIIISFDCCRLRKIIIVITRVLLLFSKNRSRRSNILILHFLPPIDIRVQLNEHLRCLDGRVEAQVSLVSELQDFFRRRAEVEMDYSKGLDKLAKSLQLRHKEQKQK